MHIISGFCSVEYRRSNSNPNGRPFGLLPTSDPAESEVGVGHPQLMKYNIAMNITQCSQSSKYDGFWWYKKKEMTKKNLAQKRNFPFFRSNNARSTLCWSPAASSCPRPTGSAGGSSTPSTPTRGRARSSVSPIENKIMDSLFNFNEVRLQYLFCL